MVHNHANHGWHHTVILWPLFSSHMSLFLKMGYPKMTWSIIILSTELPNSSIWTNPQIILFVVSYHIPLNYIVSTFIQLYRVISFKMVGFILYFCFVKSSSISRYHTWFDPKPDKPCRNRSPTSGPPIPTSPQGLRGEAPAMQAAAKGHSALLWLHLDVAHQAVVVGGDDHVPRPKKDKKPPSYWLITSIPAAIYLQPYDLWYYVYDWTYTSNYWSFKGENEDWPGFTSIFWSYPETSAKVIEPHVLNGISEAGVHVLGFHLQLQDAAIHLASHPQPQPHGHRVIWKL